MSEIGALLSLQKLIRPHFLLEGQFFEHDIDLRDIEYRFNVR